MEYSYEYSSCPITESVQVWYSIYYRHVLAQSSQMLFLIIYPHKTNTLQASLVSRVFLPLQFELQFQVIFLNNPYISSGNLSSLLALYAIWKLPSAKALSSIQKITSLRIDHSLFSILNFWIKNFAELLSLFRISCPSFIISITDKLLGMKDFFSIALFSNIFPFFHRRGQSS